MIPVSKRKRDKLGRFKIEYTKDFLKRIYKKHSGNFASIARELKIKPASSTITIKNRLGYIGLGKHSIYSSKLLKKLYIKNKGKIADIARNLNFTRSGMYKAYLKLEWYKV